MADWAQLQQDLLTLIAKRVDILEDFSSFSRVCRSWRSVAVKENFKGSQQLPWLLFAKKGENSYNHLVSATNPIGKLMLPEGKRYFESLGWLITVSATGDMDLLHPFIQAVLSSCPFVSKDNYVVVLLSEFPGVLGFWKPKKKVWTAIETRGAALRDITYYNGQLYAVNLQGEIYVCDVGGGRSSTLERVVGKMPALVLLGRKGLHRTYVVELEGELLVVVRMLNRFSPLGDDRDEDDYDDDSNGITYTTKRFTAFKVDLIKKGWEDSKSLGDNALILGYNASVSVPASKFKGVRPNCIYYTEEYWVGCTLEQARWQAWLKNLGIYNMEDKSHVLCWNEESFSPVCPPLWIIPYF